MFACVITICDVSPLGFWFGDGWISLPFSARVIVHVVGKLFSVCIYILIVLGAFFCLALVSCCMLGRWFSENCGRLFLGSQLFAAFVESNKTLQIHLRLTQINHHQSVYQTIKEKYLSIFNI
jgi:hypothetical protein